MNKEKPQKTTNQKKKRKPDQEGSRPTRFPTLAGVNPPRKIQRSTPATNQTNHNYLQLAAHETRV
jgi:7-keto-8-aminopelargonate synthetase-like enzyme